MRISKYRIDRYIKFGSTKQCRAKFYLRSGAMVANSIRALIVFVGMKITQRI